MNSSIHFLVVVLFTVVSGLLALALCDLSLLPRPSFGFRGTERALALRWLPFRIIEPPLRVVATWWSALLTLAWFRPSGEALRARQTTQLEHAGHFLGLCPDEYTSLSLLSMIVCTIAGSVVAPWVDRSHWLILGAAGTGLALPYFQVSGIVRARFKQIKRDLPTAIDLASMCVNAGLDFPGALHAITHHADKSDLVGQELIRVLAALQLGRTRKQALSELERRVPIEAIRSFVRELTQAEEKGTPIAEALSAQARINRGERSIAAEEAAARAGVLMILPMMILLGCIILMLMGPFIVGGLGL